MNKNTMSALAFLVLALIIGLAIITAFKVDWDSKIGLGQLLEIVTLIVLVLVTFAYAWSASKQANASIKMAEEMKNARAPSITMQWGGANPNKKEISANIRNKGFGPALNLICYLTHKEFGFSSKSNVYTTFEVEQKYILTLPSEEFDFKAWSGLAINCDYEGVFGEKFRSILRFESEEKRNLEIIKLKQ